MISESLYISSSEDHIYQGSGIHFQVIWLEKSGGKKARKPALWGTWEIIQAAYCTRSGKQHVALMIGMVAFIDKVPAFVCTSLMLAG